MDLVDRLLQKGFDRVLVLDAAQTGTPGQRLILAVRFYQAETEERRDHPWIHPYYPASQEAYRAARDAAKELNLQGCNENRLKPLFARLAPFQSGRNTLSYLSGAGSRFHVQQLASDEPLPVTNRLLPEAKPNFCGSCRRCMEACPAGAIREDGFHRELCLRNWQLNGQPVPEALREKMGMQLLGCDSCQRCCPHQPVPKGAPAAVPSLHALLTDVRGAAAILSPLIGSNMARPGRLLAQACLLAAEAPEERDVLRQLTEHPNQTVAEHARWALRRQVAGADGSL